MLTTHSSLTGELACLHRNLKCPLKEQSLILHKLYSNYWNSHRAIKYAVLEWCQSHREGNGNPPQCSRLENPWTEEPGSYSSRVCKRVNVTEQVNKKNSMVALIGSHSFFIFSSLLWFTMNRTSITRGERTFAQPAGTTKSSSICAPKEGGPDRGGGRWVGGAAEELGQAVALGHRAGAGFLPRETEGEGGRRESARPRVSLLQGATPVNAERKLREQTTEGRFLHLSALGSKRGSGAPLQSRLSLPEHRHSQSPVLTIQSLSLPVCHHALLLLLLVFCNRVNC